MGVAVAGALARLRNCSDAVVMLGVITATAAASSATCWRTASPWSFERR
jgi:hypothetical protein